MRRLLTDAAQTLVPPKGDQHGPLPPLMLVLTVVTGLIDAVSYLSLGRVFVANMTGNVVFLGFALAGAPGLSVTASIVSMASFLTGALAGGRLGTRFAAHRGRLLAATTAIQAVLVAGTVIAVVVSHGEGDQSGSLHPDRVARHRHGHAERRRPTAGCPGPHHDRPDAHSDRTGRRLRSRRRGDPTARATRPLGPRHVPRRSHRRPAPATRRASLHSGPHTADARGDIGSHPAPVSLKPRLDQAPIMRFPEDSAWAPLTARVFRAL
ncbi:hypothetical protein RKD41_000207 [Streptomyces tendae]